ncbi:MAG: flagellar hook-length control protein FliK [Pseudorhodoplanes sp.]|uniref:flagellar hook-length control protein FliK n=1 Tax=Pseudorhodoplanes sp. TaxID=1934341 RepID=UPI003D0E78AC
MTSVTPETSLVSHRAAKSDRAERPTDMRAHGSFAALMESEARPEPHQTDRAPRRTQTHPAARPADRHESSPECDAPAPAEPGRADPSAEAPEEAIVIAEAAAGAEPETPPATTVADAAVPVAEPLVAPVANAFPAPIPADAGIPTGASAAAPQFVAPQAVDIPETVQPGQTVPLPAASGEPAGSGADAAPQPPGQPDTAPPQIMAVSMAEKEPSGEPDLETANGALVQSDEAEGQAARPGKQAANPAATPRPELTPEPSGAPSETAVKPEEPLPAGKSTVDLAVQLASPVSTHATAIQSASPQASGVAQAVPLQALAVEIAAQSRAGNSRFEIRLDPPELGRIDVRLDIDRDGNVTSRLVIERADTYDLLRRDQSTLERALQQAGLKTSDHALEFSLRDQGFAQQRRDSDDLPRGARVAIHDTEVAPSQAANGYSRALGARGGIDIRV